MKSTQLKSTTRPAQKHASLKKRLVVAFTFAIPLMLTSGLSNQSQQAMCQNLSTDNQTISQCLANSGANNSWVAWLTGSSRSSQFQMIDLFELVNRPSENAQSGVLNTREG